MQVQKKRQVCFLFCFFTFTEIKHDDAAEIMEEATFISSSAASRLHKALPPHIQHTPRPLTELDG